MKCNFVVGQKVVCINDNWDGLTVDMSGNIVPPDQRQPRVPMINEVLTIAEMLDRFGVITLNFHGFPGFWLHTHFAPIIERKTDISVFKAMLTPAGRIPVDA